MSAPEFRGEASLEPASLPLVLAGVLAERGVGSLRLSGANGPARTLAARSTDLPGEVRAVLAGGGEARIEADSPACDLRTDASGRLAWITPDRELADALSSLGVSPDRAR